MPEKQHGDLGHLSAIGVDIGKDTFHLVGFDNAGKRVLRLKIRRLVLPQVFDKLPRRIVGMEACLSAHFVSRTLRRLGFEPRIIPAIYVKPFNKGQKNDCNDAEAIAAAEPNCGKVMSIPGIGPMISTAMVAAIGAGDGFDRGRDFAAWVGLVPRQYSTGGRTVLGRISKRGSRCLRMLFVQAAKVIMIRPHRWADFSFGAWLTRAAQRMHRNKLAVALANKLAWMAWSVLRYGTRFDESRDAAMAV